MSIACIMKKEKRACALHGHPQVDHKAQHHPSEVEVKVFRFLDVMRCVLIKQNWDLDYVMSMDQTLVYHLMEVCKLSIFALWLQTQNMSQLLLL